MTIISILFLVALAISLILMIIMNLFSIPSWSNREKLSPFECGFDPHKKSRSPFSLRFFLVTILFLIFDVEIILLIPLGVVSSSVDNQFMVTAAVIMTIVLIIGLFHEWNQSSIDWIY